MKIVQKALFRSCAARFGQIAFLSVKFSRTSNWPEILFKTGKQFALHENCTKRSFQVTRSTFWRNRIFWASKFLKSLHLSQILFKTEKQCALHENCTKRSFQVMRSTFWRNRIFERQSSQNRHTGLKFSPKREKSGLSMKIIQKAHCRSCAARFGQIAFLSVKVLKIVTMASISLKNEKNRALSMKIVQNALFRSCAARFGQIAFLSVKVLKIVTLDWNSRQNGKRVSFP